MAVATENPRSVLSRVNPRVIVVMALVLLPVGWIVWTLVSQTLSGSIEKVGDYTTANLKAMGNFPFSETSGVLADVPRQYAALDGKKMFLDGMMFAGTDAAPVVDNFQLVYSIQNCCFNGPPRVQERVFCNAPPGKKVRFVGSTLVRIYGTLHVRIVHDKDTGAVTSVFDMDVEKLKALQ
jgi:hypothetical protein